MVGRKRDKTRRQRYDDKLHKVTVMPVSLVAINFDSPDNLAFLIRTAACYGAKSLFVIGRIPHEKEIRAKSGSLADYVDVIPFSSPSVFLKYVRDNEIKVVSAEISDESTSLFEYNFNINKHTAIVLGHETIGVPIEIMLNSDLVYIPMLGPGYCLNTSQTGTAFMTEYSRQYNKTINVSI